MLKLVREPEDGLIIGAFDNAEDLNTFLNGHSSDETDFVIFDIELNSTARKVQKVFLVHLEPRTDEVLYVDHYFHPRIEDFIEIVLTREYLVVVEVVAATEEEAVEKARNFLKNATDSLTPAKPEVQ